MKTIAIVQARMGSKRLPGKVMKKIGDRTVIEILLRRLSKSSQLDQIIVASSILPENEVLSQHVEALGFSCERGSENNVLERYMRVAEKYDAAIIVRVTGDCPLISPEIVDNCITEFKKRGVDYLSNIEPPTFPDGLDVEVFSISALKNNYQNSSTAEQFEHVTSHFEDKSIYSSYCIRNSSDHSDLRWTVDEYKDLQFVRSILEYFDNDIFVNWKDVLDLCRNDASIVKINSEIQRNQGSDMNEGQKLWKHAQNLIPGGNMLLSKRSELYLPDFWPTYFSKTSGCQVWDIEGNRFFDLSVMGVGTNLLGYNRREVDEAVIETINLGNMSTLNCPEEVKLAEVLTGIHPWSDMVRFTRSGGEANSVAIRIARASTGKEKVAICGYHGWHDWYLATNIGDTTGLNEHLLEGLNPAGVPASLRGTSFQFRYNDINSLEKMLVTGEFAAIKMEVERNIPPKPGFLEKVKELSEKHNAVLIFDECTSGFRETFGGLHLKYDVEPDIAIFGKTLGNGYAINAILGKRQVMDAAQNTFISSTFWTERIGPTAALKTLEIMENEKSWETVSRIGREIKLRWKEIAQKYNLTLNHYGLDALASFELSDFSASEVKTFITQEMLKRGFLSGDCIYVSTAHTPEILDSYFCNLEEIFEIISNRSYEETLLDLLDGPVSHTGFQRLN